MELAGKNVLITGGSSGIGLATAEALAAAGARVVITGRRRAALDAALERLGGAGTGVHGIAADVATPDGRAASLAAARDRLGGLDVLINNAGGVRAGRLENTGEDEIRAMIEVNLVAPILLTREALPLLRAGGNGMVVDIASGIARVGVPFYTTYAAVKAGIAHFGEALRRELAGEGVHVLTVFPGGTDTPMMQSNRAGPDLGFGREAVEDVAAAIVRGMETDALEVVRGGEKRAEMIALNRSDPLALDARFAKLKGDLEEAVRDHSAL